MRIEVNTRVVVIVVCALQCFTPVFANQNAKLKPPNKIELTDKYFAFVNDHGALNVTYPEAQSLCEKNHGSVWDINTGPALRTGNLRADKDIARKVLDIYRSNEFVSQQIALDSILQRLNVVFGRKKDEKENACKWYIAGPYTTDFYAFTFYDACPIVKDDESRDGYYWFICEYTDKDNKTPTKPETSTTTHETTTPIDDSTATYQEDETIIERINQTIAATEDTRTLIESVNRQMAKLRKPFRGLQLIQRDFLDRIEKLVDRNATKARTATEDLFSKTVTELASNMMDKKDYLDIVRLAHNITVRVAVNTEIGTDIHNIDEKQAPLFYRMRTVRSARSLNSSVRTSSVNANLLSDNAGEETLVATHIEFRNLEVQREMIQVSYNGSQKFSSDLVEFYLRYTNGSEFNGEINVSLFFEAGSKQAKRSSHHDCVFYNVQEEKLDNFGCEFRGLTSEGKLHCHCNHTTSFGSVFLPKDFDDHYQNILDICSIVLDFFSLTALCLSILVYMLVRQIQTLLTKIHMHLCICLFVSELLTVAQSIAYRFSDEWPCNLPIGMLFHYLYLTVIAWLTLEGVFILQLMIFVFKPPETHSRFYLAFGYLVPAIFPFIAILIDDPYESSNQLCFLNKQKGSKVFWTFLAPLTIMLLVNTAAIATVMYRLCTVKRNSKTVKSELLRYLRGIVFMTILLGLQWGLGFGSLFIEHNDGAKFACVLLFVIFTLAQGPLIFIVHIMLVKDTRYAVARYLARGGSFSRSVADFIRPPPPTKETQRQSSTKTTDVVSSQCSSSSSPNLVELNSVQSNPSGRYNGAG